MIRDEQHEYQRVASDFVAQRAGSALFFEQGTGKTWVIAGVIEQLMTDDDFSCLLVVPLANVETTWSKLLRDKLPAGVRITRDWESFKRAKGHPRILLLHYEAVRGRIIQRLIKQHWTLAVWDESQRLKARASKQSRAAARFHKVHCRCVLSGTPIEQAPQDLWAQLRFAVPHALGTSWTTFSERFLRPTGYMGYKLKFIDEKLPEFLKLIEPHILRVKKEDVLNLPPIEFKRVPVMLLGEQRRVYEDLERDMITTVQGETVVADMRITQLVRLQQCAGGFVRANPTIADYAAVEGTKRRARGRIVRVGEAKLRKLRVIVSKATLPVVVFCHYIEELQQIERTFRASMRVATIHGKNRKTRTETIEAFQRGEYDVLVCQIRSGGVGIDLYRASTAIFYSMTHSFIDFDQAIARLHRYGQLNPVVIWLIFAHNTVDAPIYSAVLSKQIVSESVLHRRMTMAKKPAAAPAKTTVAAKPAKAAEKAPAAAPAEKPEKAPAEPAFKYGVKNLAEALGIKEASVRVRLRSHEVPKAGKSYGWNTKAELQTVIDTIKSEKPSKAAEDEGDDEDEAEDEE